VDKAGFADTAKAYAENIDATIEFGDYVAADQLIEEGGKRGYFAQERVQGMLAQTAARRRDDQLMTVVQEHPQEARGWFAQEDKLTEYKLTPWERQEWEHRAQSFWEDHERQSVGEVLDGMHHGEITEVKQLEHWKPDMGPKAYADLSEMLAARRPTGIAKNDPAMKEQTMATIANVRVRPGDVNSQIAAAKLGEDIKNRFTGGNREELLSKLQAAATGFDTAKNRILGPALQWLYDRVFGQFINEAAPKEVPVDAGPGGNFRMVQNDASAASSRFGVVKSIRENLEQAIKTGKIQTAEGAIEHAAKELIGSGWSVPRSVAALEGTTQQSLDSNVPLSATQRAQGMVGVAPGDASSSKSKLVANVPPPGSVLAAESPEALGQMLDDGVDLPIYTKRFGGEYDPAAEKEAERQNRMRAFPLKNNVNAPRRQNDFAGGKYTQQLLLEEVRKKRADKEREWNERITNDPQSLANGDMLEKALDDFSDGNISNQTVDRAFRTGGAPVSGTQVYLTRRAHAAEIEKRILNDPGFAKLPAPQRPQYLEKILAEGAKSFNGQWDKETWRQWGEFSAQMRNRVAGTETANEKRQYYLGFGNNSGNKDDEGKWLSGVVPDMARELVRSVIAAGHDLSVVEPSAGGDFFRMPGQNIGHGLQEWWARGSDSVRVEWSKHLTDGQRGFLDELLKLKVAIDLGELPMNDAKALGAWFEQHASALSQQQAAYYKEVMGDEPWNPAYAITNGLLHPQNAALLASYLQTRDPKVWDQLTSQLARTPRRAGIDHKSEERLKSDSVVTYLNVLTERDYKDAMKLAGDPINLAAMIFPALRAGKVGEAVVQGSKVDAALQAARGSVEGMALGNIGLSIEDPNASWARHVQTSKDMLAFSLGMGGARAGLGKVKALLPELALREEAKGKESTGDGFGEVSSELVTPLKPPPGTMMMDATGVITLSRALVTAARDARDFASWSARTAERFGEWTKPHLRGLWDAAKQGAPAVAQYLHDKVPEEELQAIQLPEGIRSALKGERQKSSNTTRTGTTRKNATDWKATRDLWDELGYGELLSEANRKLIAVRKAPMVDDAWIAIHPEDAGLRGERITMNHVHGLPMTGPLPKTRHLNAHMPGGYRHNPGGPGSQLPIHLPPPPASPSP
jgi:hypothetical protein